MSMDHGGISGMTEERDSENSNHLNITSLMVLLSFRTEVSNKQSILRFVF